MGHVYGYCIHCKMTKQVALLPLQLIPGQRRGVCEDCQAIEDAARLDFERKVVRRRRAFENRLKAKKVGRDG